MKKTLIRILGLFLIALLPIVLPIVYIYNFFFNGGHEDAWSWCELIAIAPIYMVQNGSF